MPGLTLALLRGINVGGRNVVNMAALREALETGGFGRPETYIQSGNVIFDTPDRDEAATASRISETIRDSFGLEVPVVLRALDELRSAVTRNPFGGEMPDHGKPHVVFLSAEPARHGAERLDPGRSPGDQFVLSGREIFVRYAAGAGTSKLTTDYFERTLGVTATARNVPTVERLIERMVARS